MNEWRAEQKAWNISFLPDGNGDFSRGMGVLVPKQDVGFGKRSWRYFMLVKDGVTLRAVAGRSMVPQVFVNGEHIGVRTMSPLLMATGTAT